MSVLILIGIGGCKKDKSEEKAPTEATEATGESTSTSSGEAAGEATLEALPTQTPLLSTVEAVKYMPASTLGVFAADGIAPMMTRFGRDAIVAEHSEFYTLASTGMKESIGIDLLDPAGWTEAGVDANAPMGTAFLNMAAATFAGFATVSDREKLLAFIDKMAATVPGLSVERTEQGDALILTPKQAAETTETVEREEGGVVVHRSSYEPKWAMVLRGSTILVVGSNEGQAVAQTAATVLATVSEADSLAKAATFKAAMEDLAYGKVAAGYANVGQIIQDIQTTAGNSHERAELGMLEEMVVGLFGREMQVAVGTSEDGTGMGMRAIYTLSADAGVRKFFARTEGMPTLVRATLKSPIYLANYRINIPEIVSFVRGLPGAEQGIAQVQQGLAAVSMDFQRDLVDGLSGELGVAVFGDMDAIIANPDTGMDQVGGHFLLGVKDTVRWSRLLGVLTALPPVREMVQKEGERYKATFPSPMTGGQVTIHFGFAGNYLAASTDSEFFARVAANTGQGFSESVSGPMAQAALRQSSTGVACLSFDWLYYFSMAKESGEMGVERSEPDFDHPEYKAKLAEVERLRSEHRAYQRSQEELAEKAIYELTNKLGLVCFAAQTADEGFIFTGGWYPSTPDLATFGQSLARAAATLATHYSQDGSSHEKWEAYREADEELRNLRTRLQREQREQRLQVPTAAPAPPAAPATLGQTGSGAGGGGVNKVLAPAPRPAARRAQPVPAEPPALIPTPTP